MRLGGCGRCWSRWLRPVLSYPLLVIGVRRLDAGEGNLTTDFADFSDWEREGWGEGEGEIGSADFADLRRFFFEGSRGEGEEGGWSTIEWEGRRREIDDFGILNPEPGTGEGSLTADFADFSDWEEEGWEKGRLGPLISLIWRRRDGGSWEIDDLRFRNFE